MFRFIVSLALPVAACMFLAAHYFRAGALGMIVFWLLLPGLLWMRSAWIKPAFQALLTVSMIVWIQTLADLIHFRQAFELPWLRVGLIIGGVILVSAFGVLIFEGRALQGRYIHNRETGPVQAGAFLLTLATLGLLYAELSFPVFLLERFFPGFGPVQILIMACYAAWISGKLMDPKRAPTVRARLWLFFSVVFFVQLGLGLAGWEQFLMTGKLHLPVPALIMAGPIYRGEGFFMLFLFLGTVLMVGPAWCSHLCYIGAWDHQASAMQKKPCALPAWTAKIRLILFILVPTVALGLRLAGIDWIWAVAAAAGFGFSGLGIMAVISRKTGIMAHCTVFCPIGLAAVAMGKILVHPVKAYLVS